jgi:hypothetical protein
MRGHPYLSERILPHEPVGYSRIENSARRSLDVLVAGSSDHFKWRKLHGAGIELFHLGNDGCPEFRSRHGERERELLADNDSTIMSGKLPSTNNLIGNLRAFVAESRCCGKERAHKQKRSTHPEPLLISKPDNTLHIFPHTAVLRRTPPRSFPSPIDPGRSARI